jgi:hypothetical protein
VISLGVPLALLGLLALPAIAWLHRRRRRPAPVVVPSLLFLEPEDAAALAPERVRVDAELLVALAAAALLALAAADPARTPDPGRTVRVVLHRVPALEARSADGTTGLERAHDAVAGLRGRLTGRDRLEERAVEGTIEDAVAVARSGTAALRVVVSDRLPADAPADVRFVAVGDPEAGNAGILAADATPEGASVRVFATVRNDSPRAFEGRLSLTRGAEADAKALRLGPGEAAGVVFAARSPLPQGAALTLEPGGALAADDRVVLARAPLRVGFEPPPRGYSEAHVDAVRAALGAAAPGWTVDSAHPDLWVGSAASRPDPRAVAFVLHPIAPGVEGVHAGRAPLVPIDPAFGRDVDLAGADLVYDPSVAAGAPPFPVVRAAAAGGGGGEVHWLPDPLAGSPSPADRPAWPLFVENLVRRVAPDPLAVDPDAALLGRDVAPFEARWLEAAPRDRVARPRSLRALLALGGGLCLLWLWLGPALAGPRREPRPA